MCVKLPRLTVNYDVRLCYVVIIIIIIIIIVNIIVIDILYKTSQRDNDRGVT